MTSSTQSAANDNEASEELVSKIAVAIRDAVDALVGVDAAQHVVEDVAGDADDGDADDNTQPMQELLLA